MGKLLSAVADTFLPSVDDYLGDTGVEGYLKKKYEENWGAKQFDFDQLTDELRYQHLIAIGGTGCGKSTFFQGLLVRDIKRMKKGKCSIVHIDPVQANDSIIKHARLEKFKNAILIDAADPDSLPCLDLFETSAELDERLRTSNLIGVFKAVCAGLIDQKLTQPMKTLFSYCAQVAVRMETCGLHELLGLLTDPIAVLEKYDFRLGEKVYDFFLYEVVGTNKGRLPMKETAASLRSRVHAVLGDPIIERLFCSGTPTLSITKAINEGSGIFVCTRKGFLTTEGAQLLGNYFLTLTHRAMQERVATPPEEMMPTFLYYDEVHNAFSGGHNEILAEMLDEDRKYKLSVNIATTRFGHFSTDMADAVLSGTETKLVGKMSPRGAGLVATELFGADGGGIGKLTSIGNYKFYCRIKSKHDKAIMVKTRPDPIKKLGSADPRAMKNFRERMSLKFGAGRIAIENEVAEQRPAPAESVEKSVETPKPKEKDPLAYVAHT